MQYSRVTLWKYESTPTWQVCKYHVNLLLFYFPLSLLPSRGSIWPQNLPSIGRLSLQPAVSGRVRDNFLRECTWNVTLKLCRLSSAQEKVLLPFHPSSPDDCWDLLPTYPIKAHSRLFVCLVFTFRDTEIFMDEMLCCLGFTSK